MANRTQKSKIASYKMTSCLYTAQMRGGILYMPSIIQCCPIITWDKHDMATSQALSDAPATTTWMKINHTKSIPGSKKKIFEYHSKSYLSMKTKQKPRNSRFTPKVFKNRDFFTRYNYSRDNNYFAVFPILSPFANSTAFCRPFYTNRLINLWAKQ